MGLRNPLAIEPAFQYARAAGQRYRRYHHEIRINRGTAARDGKNDTAGIIFYSMTFNGAIAGIQENRNTSRHSGDEKKKSRNCGFDEKRERVSTIALPLLGGVRAAARRPGHLPSRNPPRPSSVVRRGENPALAPAPFLSGSLVVLPAPWRHAPGVRVLHPARFRLPVERFDISTAGIDSISVEATD
ncbi:hypothetical protein [Burkholderia gladioli]|uniref:hypothetical protein n=1 Tax=Burkholderia gladioli TaxID=28095 RepID=UPI0012F96545|nr:hypothetical protein [Burkholderia gladioli]